MGSSNKLTRLSRGNQLIKETEMNQCGRKPESSLAGERRLTIFEDVMPTIPEAPQQTLLAVVQHIEMEMSQTENLQIIKADDGDKGKQIRTWKRKPASKGREIRDGKDTKILDHSWVPELVHKCPQPLGHWRQTLTWVNDLMSADGCSWNEHLPTRAFSEADRLAILGVQTIKPDQSDRWKWSLDK
ncbi:chemoreceptor McpE Globin-like haem-binding domain [Striga asiatica]|uniref:Chemoreceptor McpE Globin-like haem-binding domain n=1 Tax=Striga asiatica TaxID=4170 RepID=A0A5A7P936_STRAF|nr:chemoreceptor McpE Globin-like haem-binding domain [Striga asiatica]